MSRDLPSMNPCRSFAAWYSAFSLRSPWARASSMSRTFFGRSTSRSRLSSSRSACCPRGVIGNFAMSASLPLVLLERAHAQLARAQLGQRADGSARRRQRRVIRNPLGEGVPSDRERILDRLGPRGGVDDQLDLAVEDLVDAVGAPLADLVHALDVEPLAAQVVVRSGRRHHLEAEVDE